MLMARRSGPRGEIGFIAGPMRTRGGFRPLPPVCWRVGVQIGPGETLQTNMVRPAEIILREQFFHEEIAL